jgi:RNA-directed DNA polymerase
LEGNGGETLSSPTLSTKLQRIAEQAVDKTRVFTTLAHLIDEELLREAYRLTRKDGATGVDGQTGEAYAEQLDANLRDLHERLRSRRYSAPPIRRVHIPKASGGERPIGITTFEDKIVQRAVVMLLSAIYERDFYRFSYGFRPGLGAHRALRALREGCMALGGGWIVDADIRGFFDSVDHGVLRDILRQRVRDGGILRLIGKWLNAGVMDNGELFHPETGTPQGGVISPLLANIYLHAVLDEWFAQVVQPRLGGRSFLIRFADDFVIVCASEKDARRVLEVLPKRLAKYGLTLHPEKTRLIRFRQPEAISQKADGNGTLEFLGFTHHWTRSRRGYWVIKRRTARKALNRSMRDITLWCRNHRHFALKAQHHMLCLKLRGHYGYYGIKGNYRLLEQLYEHTKQAWVKWLNRRGGKKHFGWKAFAQLEEVLPLPLPRIVHASV